MNLGSGSTKGGRPFRLPRRFNLNDGAAEATAKTEGARESPVQK